MEGAEADFWAERPKCLPISRDILNVFWSLKRESGIDALIKKSEIEKITYQIMLESDITTLIIQHLDDYHRELYTAELLRKSKKK
jgi:hypothetical protein